MLPLAEVLLEDIGRQLGRRPAGLSREAVPRLLAYPWPGNVRELRNVLERAAILAGGGLITSDHLALPGRRSGRPRGDAAAQPSVPLAGGDTGPGHGARTRPATLPDVERQMVERALIGARYNKSRAARALGLTRAQFYVRLKRYGLVTERSTTAR